MKRSFLSPRLAIILLFSIFQFSATATQYPINVTFSGLQETPANNSTATGTFVGTYNDVTDSLIYTITFSGLGSNVTAAHFHGFVPPGIAGHVITGGSTSFTVTVNEQVAVLPEPSVALAVTVVVPTGKKDPDAG